MKNKKLLLGVVALAVAVAVLLGVYFGTRPEAVSGEKTVTVEVIHKDGTQKEFTYSTEEGYLGALLLAEGLAEGETGQYGLVIAAVDGETADWTADKSYWAVYIGEDYATTGADGIVLTDGGEYSLVYTIG